MGGRPLSKAAITTDARLQASNLRRPRLRAMDSTGRVIRRVRSASPHSRERGVSGLCERGAEQRVNLFARQVEERMGTSLKEDVSRRGIRDDIPPVKHDTANPCNGPM